MSITVTSLTPTPCGCFYRATFAAGGQVVGTTLVGGLVSRAKALAAARAIAARVSSSAPQPCS